MKKLIVAGFFVYLCIPNISFAKEAFVTDLFYGSTGTDVAALQDFLTDQEVYSGPISGNFYSLTQSAVRRFQAAQNIQPSTGYFGPKTRAVVNAMVQIPIDENDENAAENQSPGLYGTSYLETAPVPHTVTTPSGAILTLDQNGNVLNSANLPAPSPAPIVVLSSPYVQPTDATQTLTLSPVQIQNLSYNSATFKWTTTIPSESKLFITSQVNTSSILAFPSQAGKSTEHFVTLETLTPLTSYSYTVEAINGIQVQKQTGTFATLLEPKVLKAELFNYTTVKLLTNFPINYHATTLVDTKGNVLNFDGPVITASLNSDGTYSYEWTPLSWIPEIPPTKWPAYAYSTPYQMILRNADQIKLTSKPFTNNGYDSWISF